MAIEHAGKKCYLTFKKITFGSASLDICSFFWQADYYLTLGGVEPLNRIYCLISISIISEILRDGSDIPEGSLCPRLKAECDMSGYEFGPVPSGMELREVK